MDADLPVCDPHHHLFTTRFGGYELDELHADTEAGHNVVTTVYAESGESWRDDGPEWLRPVGETEYVARIAAASDRSTGARIAGIVAYADLTVELDTLGEVLSAHEVAGEGRFRGIRQSLAWDADPALSSYSPVSPTVMADPAFRRGLAELGGRGFTFDAWLYHPQLPQFAELARAVPDTTIILNHLGGPVGIGPYTDRDAVRAAWRPAIRDVATCPNVVVKLGGIGMPRFGMRWRDRPRPPGSSELAAHWRPEVEWAIECFGVERCMFESNFPVDRDSSSYVVLWNTFKRLTAGASAAARAALFHDNAVRTYGL